MPNWGTTGDRDPRDSFGGVTSLITLRHWPDPDLLGLAAAPATGVDMRPVLEPSPSRCGPTAE